MSLKKQAVLGKIFGKAFKEYKKGGAKRVVNYLSRFKDPAHAPRLKNMPKTVPIEESQKVKAGLGRGVRTSIGNMAENSRILTKGLKGKSFLEGTKQITKNTGELMARQVKGDTLKEISGPITRKGGKDFVKSKVPFLKDREVISRTGRDSYIVKKRKAMQPLSVALGGSGASIGAASYVLSDKKEPQSKRLQRAARDTALFTAGIPIGIAGTILLPNERKEQLKEKRKNKKILGE